MSEAPHQPKSARPRKRRRAWPWVAVVAVLVLMGRGLGWFGEGASEVDGSPAREHAAHGDRSTNNGGAATGLPAKPGSRAEGSSAQRPKHDVPVRQDGAGRQPATLAGDATQGAVAPGGKEPPVAGPSVAEPPVAGLPPDRLESLVSLVELRLGQHRYAAASRAADRLRAQSLSEPQQHAVQMLHGRIERERVSTCSQLIEQLQAGYVLEAERLSTRLLGNDQASDDALARAMPQFGLRGDWRRAVELEQHVVPAAAPLPKKQRVRLMWREQSRVGTVASSRSDRVTVRIRDGQSQSYPTVARCELEPVDAAASDAVEMALACVHAGRPLLARLWLAAAHLSAAGELGDRGERVRKLLR